MRLIQLWLRVFVVSLGLRALSLIALAMGAEPPWLDSLVGTVAVSIAFVGIVLIVIILLRVAFLRRSMSRARAARRDAVITTPYDVVDRAFGPLVESGALRNLSVAAIIPGQPLIFHSGNDTEARETRLYEIGSLTKPMTAEILATMIADGTAAMTTRVGDVFKESSLPDEIAAITLQELVTHQSGLPRIPRTFRMTLAAMFSSDPYCWITGPVLLASLARASRTKPPGTYSNFGFAVLGKVLGELDRSDYMHALQARLLRLLSLDDTDMDREGPAATRLVRGHDLIGVPTPHWHFGAMVGAGGVCMTIADGAVWLAAHVAPPEQFREVVTMVTRPVAAFGADRIGMGWLIREIDGTSIVWHNGGTGGFSSFAAFAPARKVGVIAFAASFHTAALDRAGFRVVRELATGWGDNNATSHSY